MIYRNAFIAEAEFGSQDSESEYGKIQAKQEMLGRVVCCCDETCSNEVAQSTDQAGSTRRNVQTVEGRRATVYAG